MQKIKMLLCAAFLVAASAVFGQSEKNVSLIKEGAKLTDGDIGFLSMVAGEKIVKGNTARQATIKGVTYKAGMTLSKTDATNINAAITAFQKTYKAPAKSRGNDGLCYYWYYYCDGYGYCYWYKYYYYC